MRFLRVDEATEADLLAQLRICFRFGLATAADPQLWWDSFKYAVSLGHQHGLVGFMPSGAAIALPCTDSRIVSSRDVQRLHVALPCVLGLRRKGTAMNSKHTLAIPPSASTEWGARVCWELAMVQAFGVTYPAADVGRIPAGALAAELLYAVAEARDHGDTATLEAVGELLDIYESRMPMLLPMLRKASEESRRPEQVRDPHNMGYLPTVWP